MANYKRKRANTAGNPTFIKIEKAAAELKDKSKKDKVLDLQRAAESIAEVSVKKAAELLAVNKAKAIIL